MVPPTTQQKAQLASREDGFGLVGLIVAIFLILLSLSVAAPTVARALRREREIEAVHRADEYVNAIRRYHLKTGAYPGSIEQLEKTNNIRYIRQKYNDPMTGKPDWRLIKVGENKTTVKGFFGQPLAGLATTGIGSSSASSTGAPGSMAGATSGPTSGSFGASSGGAGTTAVGQGAGSGASDSASSFGGGTTSSFGTSTSGSGVGGSAGTTGFGSSGSQSSSSFSGSGAPFLGVGLPSPGSAIIVVNEQTTYPEWEFIYDPRIEQLRAKVNILGGGMSSASSSSLGALSGSQSNTPGSSPGATSTNPTPPATNTPQ